MKVNLVENPSIKKKRRPIFTIISVCLLAITLCFSVASWCYDLYENPEHKFVLSESFHIGFGRGSQHPVSGSITFFNGDNPYAGSIIRLATREQPEKTLGWYLSIYGLGYKIYSTELGAKTEAMYCCDLPGIYYRYFRLPSSTIWTLTIGLWLPLTVFSLLPGIQIWKYKSKRGIK
jgi:hypothetical protein